jgi:hypothetical protein
MAGTFTPDWNAFNSNMNNIWSFLTGAVDTVGAIAALPEVLVGYAFQILQVMLYPFGYLLNILIGVVNGSISPIITFFGNIWELGNIFYEVLATFDGVFPSEWTFLLGAMITITIGLRIYSLIPLIGGGKS